MYYFLVIDLFIVGFNIFGNVHSQFNDICGVNNGRRFYLEHGNTGSLLADYKNNVLEVLNRNVSSRCTLEFITCPSCIIEVKFKYLNISRHCGKASIFDTCGCDYVWIYEPPAEDVSGEQFCGRFIQNNVTQLTYISQTRTVSFAFTYNHEYGHAFALDYSTKRNRIELNGYPKVGYMNNASQFLSSPFFPYTYPLDLNVEYVVSCESIEPCRISLLFTDFIIAESSIIEFFDWNGQRMYVTSGHIFRPPVLITSGPKLVIRFYANGASDFGFKASYSFMLGNLDNFAFKPNIACGGHVNNLGGGITMMNMVEDGTKFFDCVWLIKPPETFLHRKTHLYVKVVTFLDFAGTTELVIRQGLTSNQPSIEVLKHPMTHFSVSKQTEHVVPISQGFYVRLRGLFSAKSRLAIVFAAFNYKDCFAGSDFLCHNLRCISVLLNCDGFDHCGDNSDESSNCSRDTKDYRAYSQIPNFLFPKTNPYSDITTATFVFLTCTFGLIGIILAMALLLYRVNTRARHQRQIQDHIETIHAILEGVPEIEEEIIVPDEPPDYEAPPEYEDILDLKYLRKIRKLNSSRCSQCSLSKSDSLESVILTLNMQQSTTDENLPALASTSKSCQTTPLGIPQSPPPAYENIKNACFQRTPTIDLEVASSLNNLQNSPGPSRTFSEEIKLEVEKKEILEGKVTISFDNIPKYPSLIFNEIRKSFNHCKSIHFIQATSRMISFSEENLGRYFSDSELLCNTNTNITCSEDRNKFKKSFSTDDISCL